MPGDKLSDILRIVKRVKPVWSGVVPVGRSKGRAVPGDKLSDILRIVTRVKPVWSGVVPAWCANEKGLLHFAAVPQAVKEPSSCEES